MSKLSKNKNLASVRKFFEPLYERGLSSQEVLEIEGNLKAFGKAILEIAGKIEARPTADYGRGLKRLLSASS